MSHNKTSKFKVFKNSKIYTFVFVKIVSRFSSYSFFECDIPIKKRPLFLKAFVPIISVSLKIELSCRKWTPCPAPGAPSGVKSGRSRVKDIQA